MAQPELVYLADAPDLVPALAQAFAAEWPEYYGPGGPGDATANLTESCNRDRLPIAVAAVVDGRAVGTAAMKESSMATHPHLRPWLAAIWVDPAQRGAGIGGALVKRIEHEAIRLGFSQIHCGSEPESKMLLRRGWKIISGGAPTLRDPVAIFRKELDGQFE